MLFSVIVPVYNVENFLERCLDSIICQTYSDFECIVIDDGSQDSSGAICDDYANRDSRIKVVHQKNAGLGAARNTGLENAIGDYICFCDSDDWVEKDLLHELLKKISSDGPDVVIYGLAYIFKDRKDFNIYHKEDIEIVKNRIITNEWTCTACNKCFKKDLFNGQRFPEGVLYEDAAFIPQLVFQAEKIEVIDKCFYNYDLRRDNSITRIKKSNRVYDLFLAQVSNVDFAEKNNLVTVRICAYNLLMTAYDCLLLDCKDTLLNKEQKEHIFEVVHKNERRIEINALKNNLSKNELKLKYKFLHSKLKYYVGKKDFTKIASSFCAYSIAKLKYFVC